jgi:hypothetical protein
MTPVLENAQLGSDLDCQNFDLLKIRHMYPVPTGLVALDDPKLYDPRVPPFGSVLNDHVAATADIQQSKLSLNGSVPMPWLGTGADQAAPGNLVERVANKGVPGGYAAVDAQGRLLSGNVATGAASGTVNSVALSTPGGVLVSGSPITTSGSFAVTFKPSLNNSWFGVKEGAPVPSSYSTDIPLEIVPPLDASKFTTGTFAIERLPEAIGLGLSHAKGVVPDTGKTGDASEYLGRDMQWHHFDTDKSYQPTVPVPNIVFTPSKEPEGGTVTIQRILQKSFIFYKVETPDDFGSPVFTEAHGGSVAFAINLEDTVYAYAAKEGYNNSEIVHFSPTSGDIMAELPLI